MNRTNCLALAVLLLLLLAGACRGERPRNAHLSVIDNEFVYVHVGYPGQDIALRLRWDVAYIALFPTVDLSSTSRTYCSDERTDLFCLGPTCPRLPFTYTNGEPPPMHPDATASFELSGYSGVLGLAPGSPIYGVFPWVRYGKSELELFVHAPPPPGNSLRPFASVVDATSVFAARVDKVPYSFAVDMSVDYTLLPWELSQRTSRWSLEIIRPTVTAAGQQSFKRGMKLRIVPREEHMHNPDNTLVPLMLPHTSGHLDSVAASATVLSGGAWNASAALVMGRLMTQNFFTVVLFASGGVVWIETSAANWPLIDEINYLPFLPVLIMLLLLWQVAMYEDVTMAERNCSLDIYPPASRQQVVHLSDGTSIDITFRRPILPHGIDNPAYPSTLIAFRKSGFVRALSWFTTLEALLIFFTIMMGFGLGSAFHPTHTRALDLVAIYSAGGVMLALCAGAACVSSQPVTGTIYGTCVQLIAIWLLAMISPFGTVMIIVILLSSGVLCAEALLLLISSVLGTLWPGIVYGTRMRSPFYREGAHPPFKLSLYLFWLALNGAFAAWASWFFAFYTIPFIVVDWRAGHPSVYGAGALGWVVAALCAFGFYHSHRLLMAEIGIIGAGRAFLYNLIARDQIVHHSVKV